MSLILPGVDIARIQYLEAQAEKYFIMAENEERDKRLRQEPATHPARALAY